MILHITLPEDWAAARRTGRYTASTRGASIDDVGFLHASDDAAQVGVVGAAIYPDRPDAFVCGLDEDELAGAGLRVRREPTIFVAEGTEFVARTVLDDPVGALSALWGGM